MASAPLSIKYQGCPIPGIFISGVSDGTTIDPQTGAVIPAGIPFTYFIPAPAGSYSCGPLAVTQSPLIPSTKQPIIANPKFISPAVSYNAQTGTVRALYTPPTGGASSFIEQKLGQPWYATGNLHATIPGVTLGRSLPSGGQGRGYLTYDNNLYVEFYSNPNAYFKINIQQISYYGGPPSFYYVYIDQYNNIYVAINEHVLNYVNSTIQIASSVQVSTDLGATCSVLHATGVHDESNGDYILDFGNLPSSAAGGVIAEQYALVEPSSSGVLTLWGGYNYPVYAAKGSVSLGSAVNSATEYTTVYPDSNVTYNFINTKVSLVPINAAETVNIVVSPPSSFPITAASIATDNVANTIIVSTNGFLYGVAASYENVLTNFSQLLCELLDNTNFWKKVIFIPPTNDGSVFNSGLFVGICASGRSGYSTTGTAWTLGTLPPGIVSSISDVTFDNGLVVIVGLKGYIAYTADMVHWVVVNPVITTTGEVLTAAIDFVSVTP